MVESLAREVELTRRRCYTLPVLLWSARLVRAFNVLHKGIEDKEKLI
jgi:hypothetical protein